MLGFFSVSPLTPGAWLGLLDDAGLPHSLRRLPLTVEVNGRRRHADARCLPVLSATAYLLSEERVDGSPSLRAWRLVARLADQVARTGEPLPDLSRFAAAFPPLGHCVVPDLEEFAEPPVPAEDVLREFVNSLLRSLAAAVREPRLLTLPDVHGDSIDLSVLQPALRTVAPDLGAVAPVVRLRDSLDKLTLTLSLPPSPDSGWPLVVTPPNAPAVARAARILPLLGKLRNGTAELTLDQVGELRLASAALEFSGATVELPEELKETSELELEDAELRFQAEPLSLGGVVSYDLRAALGGHQISDEEFRALAAATQPLVRLGGEWRLLNDKEMRRAKQLAQLAVHGGGLPALTALGATLAGDADLRGFDVSVEAMAGGELATLAGQLRDPAMREPMQPTNGFHGELRPYQLAGLGWLVRMRELGIGALLADDMGLGKTVQLIAYLLDESDEPEVADADRLPGLGDGQLGARAAPLRARRCRCTCTTGPTAPATPMRCAATTSC